MTSPKRLVSLTTRLPASMLPMRTCAKLASLGVRLAPSLECGSSMRDSELRICWHWDYPMDALKLALHLVIPGEAIDTMQYPPTNTETYEVINKHIQAALTELGIDVDHRAGTQYVSSANQEHETPERLARNVNPQWRIVHDPIRELE